MFWAACLVRSCSWCLPVRAAAVGGGSACVGHCVSYCGGCFTVNSRPMYGTVTFIGCSLCYTNSAVLTRIRVTVVFIFTRDSSPPRRTGTSEVFAVDLTHATMMTGIRVTVVTLCTIDPFVTWLACTSITTTVLKTGTTILTWVGMTLQLLFTIETSKSLWTLTFVCPGDFLIT